MQVDVGLLPLGQHMFDEPLSLSRLCAGQKHLAHRVGHLGLVSGCAFSLSVRSRKEVRAALEPVLLSRKSKKGNRFLALLTAYSERQEEVEAPAEILFGGFACFFSLLGSEC